MGKGQHPYRNFTRLFHGFLTQPPQQQCEIGTIIFILQVKTFKFSKVNERLVIGKETNRGCRRVFLCIAYFTQEIQVKALTWFKIALYNHRVLLRVMLLRG